LTKLGYDVVNVTGGFGSYVGTKRKWLRRRILWKERYW
jgi:hypothetical protein